MGSPMLDSAAQLVLRHTEEISGSPLLVVNPPEHAVARLHAEWADRVIDVWAFHVRSTQEALHHVCFAAQYTPPTNVHYSGILVFLPKEKQLMAMLMANLAAICKPGTPIWVCGHNDSGIRSQLKIQHPCWQPMRKIASGNHCQLLASELHQTTVFSLQDWIAQYSIHQGRDEFTITSLPGVFSAEHLDAGTALLLQHLPANIGGHVLDFGCGAGVISAILTSFPQVQHISALDVSALALTATELTLKSSRIPAKSKTRPEITLVRSDGLASFTGSVDWIVSNPPFHSGKRTDYDITRNFIMQSRTLLRRGGRLVIVANRFLPYRELLEATYSRVETLAENNKFIVWSAS